MGDIVAGVAATVPGTESDVAAVCPLLVPLSTGRDITMAPEVEILCLNGVAKSKELPSRPLGFRHMSTAKDAPDLGRCHATWQITGRLHYRCQQPIAPH